MRPETTPAQAIEQLYEEHHQPILRYLKRLVRERETAEDLCHETFLKALRHWGQHDPAASTKSWLYRIATNTAYDHLRRGRRIAIVPLIHDDTAPLMSQEPQVDVAEPVWAAFQRIPEQYRIPLMLHSWAGYPLKDIATVLGSNVATIKTRVHRGRAYFRLVYAA
jgi:RNA polymerase sigma-70 factor (ECF subfamily)